jgi:hypothetical protein
METSLMKGSLLELDGISRERHDEILVHSQMSDRERVVRASNFCTNTL